MIRAKQLFWVIFFFSGGIGNSKISELIMQKPQQDKVPDSIKQAVLAQSSTIPENTPIVKGKG